MGYIFLGLAAMNVIGLSGAALLMFAHGLSIAALFAITGMIRERQLNLSFDSLGGLAKPMPSLGFAFGMAAFASIGLPGFGNFSSEVMVFFGAFKNGPASLQFSPMQVATICALWGVVISAVYMLRGYRAVFFGEPAKPIAAWTNPTRLARWPVILLLAALLAAGIAPNYFLSFIRPTVEALLR
jgi:NADH-quinone oxidoreductase subunit M